MTHAHRNYIRTETMISMVINAAISAGFVWLVFGGVARVPVWGSGGLAVDFLPQTFMITLMSVLVPSAITRKRCRAGLIEAGPRTLVWLPRNLLLRALVAAVLSAILFSAVGAAVLAALAGDSVEITAVWPLKIVYGALLAAIITPFALRAALADGIGRRSPAV